MCCAFAFLLCVVNVCCAFAIVGLGFCVVCVSLDVVVLWSRLNGCCLCCLRLFVCCVVACVWCVCFLVVCFLLRSVGLRSGLLVVIICALPCSFSFVL